MSSKAPQPLSLVDLRLLASRAVIKDELQSDQLFILNHPQDIPLLVSLMPPDAYYGIIIQADPAIDIHKTPIVVHNNRYLILDSLGDHDGLPMLRDIISANAHKNGVEAHIIAPQFQRQSDTYSCGTDAFVVISEALKLGPSILEEHAKNGPRYLAAQFAKWTQGRTRLEPLYKKGAKGHELFKLHPKVAKQPIESGGQKDTAKDFVNRHLTDNGKYNLAIDKIRGRQNAILRVETKHLSEESYQDALLSGSAVEKLLDLPYKRLESLFLQYTGRSESTLADGICASETTFDELTAKKNLCEIEMNSAIESYLNGEQFIALQDILSHVFALRNVEKRLREKYSAAKSERAYSSPKHFAAICPSHFSDSASSPRFFSRSNSRSASSSSTPNSEKNSMLSPRMNSRGSSSPFSPLSKSIRTGDTEDSGVVDVKQSGHASATDGLNPPTPLAWDDSVIQSPRNRRNTPTSLQRSAEKTISDKKLHSCNLR